MDKKIITALVVLILIIGGYYYWKTSATEQNLLPAIDTGAINPMENVQSANPYQKTNPFSDIKVNPFQ